MNWPITKNVLKVSIISVFVISAFACKSQAQSYPAEWDTMDADQLIRVANKCVKKLDGAPDVSVFTDYVHTKYITQPAKLSQLTNFDVQVFCWAATRDLSGSEKAVWADNIKTVFANDQGEFNKYSIKDAVYMAEALVFMDSTIGSAMLKSYILSKPITDCDARHVGRAAWCLSKLGDESLAASEKLADYISTEGVADAQAVRSTSMSTWRNVAWVLHDKTSPANKLAWGTKLRQTFAGDEVLIATISSSDLSKLIEICGWLGDTDAKGLLVARNAAQATLDSDDPQDLWRFIHVARHHGSSDQSTRDTLSKKIIEKYTGVQKERELTSFECSVMSFAYAMAKQKDEQIAMAEMAYSTALGSEVSRQSISTFSLNVLCWTMFDAGLLEGVVEYPEIASVLASQALSGIFDDGVAEPSKPRWFGVACRAPGSRLQLQSLLTTSEGTPRYGLCQILSWSYRRTSDIGDWLSYLDQRIEESNQSSDINAQWLLCRAYTESVIPGNFAPLAGKKWLRQALANAASPEIKIKALSALANGYASEGRHDLAISLLQSVEGQFEGSDSLASISTLTSEILRAQKEYQHKRVRAKELHVAAVKNAWTQEMQKRLSAAEARGDSVEISNIRNLLGL